MISAAEDPFCGKWKLNQEKSKVAGERLKIDDLGGNKYKFTHGNVSDTVVADVKIGSPELWEVESYDTNDHTLEMTDTVKGRVIDHSRFEVSPDGKTLTVTLHETGQPNAMTIVYDKM